MTLHTRTSSIEDLQIRSEQDGPTRIEGYFALFDTPSQPLWQLGGAREIIARGAFTRALADGDDVRLLQNHDPNILLARTKAGTLLLRQDERGLWGSATLPDTTAARDLVENMRLGNINQNSFAMVIDEQAWETRNGEQFSVVKSVQLRDVSIVTYPAYTETFSELRSIAELAVKQDPTQQDRDALKAFADKLTKNINNSVSPSEGGLSDVSAPAGIKARAIARERELALLEIS